VLIADQLPIYLWGGAGISQVVRCLLQLMTTLQLIAMNGWNSLIEQCLLFITFN